MRKHPRSHSAFTIVELLIVIVVIAILAALAIVAYRGIQVRASATALKSDLSQAAKQLAQEKVLNDAYPGTDDTKTNGSPLLTPSPTNTFQYTRTDAGASYCLTATSSRAGVPAFMISSDNTTPREGTCPGHDGPVAGGSGSDGGGSSSTTIATNAPIQSITQAQCQALPTFTGTNNDAIRTVTDTRGGTTRTYEMAKLADGKCWMLTNLKLGGANPITLTPSDSDVASNFTLPALQTSGSTSYDNPQAIGPVPGDTGSGATNYGYLYNFPAATAGATRTSLPASSTANAPHSICPSGWKLPTGRGGSSGGDFAQLDITFGGTGNGATNGPSQSHWLNGGAFKGVFSGIWHGSFSYQGSSGFWWSSSAHSSSTDAAHNANLSASNVNPGDNYYNRYAGLGVRCLLR